LINIIIKINKSFFVLESTLKSNIHQNTKWIPNGVTVAGGNGKGNALNQLNDPCGMHVGDDQTIYVADYENHSIVEWKCGASSGQIVAGGNEKGNATNQLSHPLDVIVDRERNNLIICDFENRRVMQWTRQNGTSGQIIISDTECRRLAMDNSGYLYISSWEKDEVRRWKIGDICGTLVAGGNGKGNCLNQLNCPTFIFVDENDSVYVADKGNHRVMKWMKGEKEGIIVAGGQGQGNSLRQLSDPQGLLVDHLGTVYVADCSNNRIMRWYKEATQGDIVVGGNGEEQLYGSMGLLFDRQGNLYVAERLNYRVQRFNIDRS
jgi:sugar lactone lactonase YvrE